MNRALDDGVLGWEVVGSGDLVGGTGGRGELGFGGVGTELADDGPAKRTC
jgi:hypothetical protein